MEEQKKLKVKTVEVPDLRATLLSLEIGETGMISIRDFKPQVVRNHVRRMKNHDFKCSEAGLIDGIKVTRLS